MSTHKDRVVLAYSGGLDTSVAIGWIGEATGREVRSMFAWRADVDKDYTEGSVAR